jgi:hypothetical protein
VKLAAIKSEMMDVLASFRQSIAEAAIVQLSRGDKGPSPRAVRVAMQIVFATITDAIIHAKPGPMRAGSRRMTDALTMVALGYLGLAEVARWAGDEAEGEDPGEEETESAASVQLRENVGAAYDPILRAYRTSASSAAGSGPEPGRAVEVQADNGPLPVKHAFRTTPRRLDGSVPTIKPRALKPSDSVVMKPKRKNRFI